MQYSVSVCRAPLSTTATAITSRVSLAVLGLAKTYDLRQADASVLSVDVDTTDVQGEERLCTIGTLHYNWPMSAHASGLQHVQCTDTVIMPNKIP